MSISASLNWFIYSSFDRMIPVCLQDSEGVAVLDDVPSDRTGHQRRGVKG